jgi:hypothetical protein
LIEGTNARMADLILTAEQNGEGIDVDDTFVVEALAHADQYGKWSAEGERAGYISRWRSDETASAAERTIEADPETQEARFEGMARELRKASTPRCGVISPLGARPARGWLAPDLRPSHVPVVGLLRRTRRRVLAGVAAIEEDVRANAVTILLPEAGVGVALSAVVLAAMAVFTTFFDDYYRRVLETASGSVRAALLPYR